ncbi:hypothetical protein F2P47_12040 [Parvibaculum sedimenti]|uniref:Uncharacterized protein n=1 Tax=Parvibaculum sedimenti TaxID=2608632 RepID=A0A6N6VKG6_9HYPH|nr:hypothetical protein [Parvibaculum sedimenti]KAB7739445.1 hypothetical protein F2P47_12040 [Parvibaculum sedimenti]
MSTKKKTNITKTSGAHIGRNAATGRLSTCKAAVKNQKTSAFGVMRGTMVIKGDVVSPLYGRNSSKS